jgi:O-antigen ligase
MSFLLALTLLLTPAYVIKFKLFGFPTDILMIWVVLFWIIFAVWLITKNRLADFWDSIKSLDKKLLILILLFFLSGIISLFINGIDRPKLGQFIVLFLQPISIFFIGRYLIALFPKATNYLLLTTYFLLTIAGAYAIIQYFTLLGLPPAWWGNSNEPKRALSFFVHPNFYALWCAPLLAFLIPDVFQKIKKSVIPSPSTPGEESLISSTIVKGSLHSSPSRLSLEATLSGAERSDALVGRDDSKKNISCVIAWVLGAAGLLLSLSRAGWLGLAAAVLVYLIFAADAKIRKISFAAVIVMVIVIVSIPNLRWRFLLPFYGEKSSVSRLSLWQTGVKGIKESPVFGLGLTGFSRQWETLNTDPGLTDTHNFPHNIFLDLWVETGLIGLISLIGLIGLYIYRGLRGASPPFQGGVPREAGRGGWSNERLIKLGISLFLIALLIQGQIDNPYFKNDLAMVFWIILSLTA